jgi:hypothetical protein
MNPLDLPSPSNGKRHKGRRFVVLGIGNLLSDALIHNPTTFPANILDNSVSQGPYVLTISSKGADVSKYVYTDGECLPGKPVHQYYVFDAFTETPAASDSINKRTTGNPY